MWISPNVVLDVRANYFRFVQLTPGYTGAGAIHYAALRLA